MKPIRQAGGGLQPRLRHPDHYLHGAKRNGTQKVTAFTPLVPSILCSAVQCSVQVIALEGATLLGALAEVLGLTHLLAFLGLQAVGNTAEEIHNTGHGHRQDV